MKLLNTLFLVIIIMSFSFADAAITGDIVISGKAIIPIAQLQELDAKAIKVDKKTKIKISENTKKIITEDYNHPTERYENIIRDYTIQQGILWTIITICLDAVI